MPHASTMTKIEQCQQRIFPRAAPRQMARVCSSLLVPLMIAVFTIVTTILQMNLAKQQREQDLHIAKENRENDERIAESYHTAEAKAQEDQQMNTILGVYFKDMAELMLSKNFTLTNEVIATVISAKTLTTIGQLDGKRKGHLIRFIYEARMINANQPSIDLTDADLSNVDLTNYKLINVSFMKCNLLKAIFRETSLQDINFESAELISASFDKADLTNVRFYKANLTKASFIHTKLNEVNYYGSTVTHTDFSNINAPNLVWSSIQGNNTIFNEAEIPGAIFDRSTLINTSFVKARVFEADMTYARLDKANFTDANLFSTNFFYSELPESIFDRSIVKGSRFYGTNLVGTKWLNTDVINVDFSHANLSWASISDDQIRRALKTVDIILPDGTKGFDTNLLENGGAEDLNHQCQTSPWHVNSILAEKYETTIWDSFGRCHFTKQWDTMQATMWQRIPVPVMYKEWIQTGVAIIRITGRCWCDTGFAMHVSQFNGNSNTSLLSDTHNSTIYMEDNAEVLLSTHTMMTEIKLEIVFTGECSSWRMSGTCDNLKLTIWHRNYTL